MTIEEFIAQIVKTGNENCYICRFYRLPVIDNMNLCSKSEELTGEAILVNAAYKCGYFESKLSVKDVIKKLNVRNLEEKQDNNCSTCRKSVVEETDDRSGKWRGTCLKVKEIGGVVDETNDMIVCDCFEKREDNK